MHSLTKFIVNVTKDYYKGTFYGPDQKLWRQLQKWMLFLSPQAM